MKLIAVVILTGFLAACVTHAPSATVPGGSSLKSYTVTITWMTSDICKVDKVTEQSTDCVDDKPGFCVARTDFIIWQSNNPSNADYDIYFDPIRGMPLQARGNGRIVRQIDDNAPLAEYKYSIVRDGCTPNEENTFDPRIRIDH